MPLANRSRETGEHGRGVMNQIPHTITPTVSVVMPTYNGQRFLRRAVESILNQTFCDFELIVIDDASTDSTPRIIADFDDDRLIVMTNERNLGIAGATNRGLAAARGEYVALQDHDDISLPHRLQTQVDYLDAHPKIALVGSAATLIDENDTPYGDFLQPCEEIDLKWELLWSCPIHHTSVMVRRSAIVDVGGYRQDDALRFAEAWDPLARIAMRYGTVNLPDRLVCWRRHSQATSIQCKEQQISACKVTIFRNVRRLSDARNGVGLPHGASTPANTRKHDDGGFAVSNTGPEEQYRYCFEGSNAFRFTPAGEFPTLPPEQVTAGLRFLCHIQRTFYRMHNFPHCAVAKHRRSISWVWGKHALALAVRAPWDTRSRLHIFMLGVRCLQQAACAASVTALNRLFGGGR